MYFVVSFKVFGRSCGVIGAHSDSFVIHMTFNVLACVLACIKEENIF